MTLTRATGSNDPRKQISVDAWNAIIDKLGELVSVKDFGAIGNGSADDIEAFEATFQASRRVFVPAGIYSFSRPLILPDEDGLELFGEGWASKITGGSANGLIELGSSDGVVVRDLWLHAETANSSHGCLQTFHTDLSNVAVERVKMTTGATGNGTKLVTDNAATGVDGFTLRDCVIESPGRMGIEVQNHGSGGTIRYRRVIIERCTISDTRGGTSGMGVSLSGIGEDCTLSRNQFDGCTGPAIELIGASKSFVQHNTIRNQVASRPIQTANSTLMTGNVITHNIVVGGTPTSVYLGSLHGALIAHNDFDLSGGAFGVVLAGTATGSSHNRIVGNRIVTKSSVALLNDNIGHTTISDNDIDNSGAAGNTAAIQLYNANSAYCYVARNRINKGTGGSYTAESSAGAGNVFDANIESGATALRIRRRAGEYTGFATYDPPSIAAGSTATTTVTVTGAVMEDYAWASFSRSLSGLVITAYVSAANTVTVVLFNPTANSLDIGSGTLRARTSSYQI